MRLRWTRFLSRCTLDPGAVIFYERFQGITTTTRTHAETKPKLASEFCEIPQGECCLPKRCFVDFRYIYRFDDIAIASRLRSRSIKHVGDLPIPVLTRILAKLNPMLGC